MGPQKFTDSLVPFSLDGVQQDMVEFGGPISFCLLSYKGKQSSLLASDSMATDRAIASAQSSLDMALGMVKVIPYLNFTEGLTSLFSCWGK